MGGLNLKKAVPEVGERYGKLTVLGTVKTKKHGTRYRVGCVCGNSRDLVNAGQLLKGRITECSRCRKERD